LRSVSGLEAVYEDYAPRGVTFHFVYSTLAHPGLYGYVTPFTLQERMMHVLEAERTIGARIPWLTDTMSNDAARALGASPGSELVFDDEGRLVVRRLWTNPEALREDLAELVGASETTTQAVTLKITTNPRDTRAARVVASRLDVPWGMRALLLEPRRGDDGAPFYVKLRAEAEPALLTRGEGKLYLGFFLDPLYHVHWSNDVEPIHFELHTPDSITVLPSSGRARNSKPHADRDPREFLLDARATMTDEPIEATVRYFACDDAETFCVPVTQSYRIFLEHDMDGGRRLAGPPRVRRLVEHDANSDGRIQRDELPESLRAGFKIFDLDGNGVLDENELRQAALRLREMRQGSGSLMQRIMELDNDGDGRVHRGEIPDAMENLHQVFEQLDLNGDGFIDVREAAILRRSMERRPR
jgi:Ca2+-binding EF-hand superfamily protein